VTVPACVDLIYEQFARYPFPASVSVCEQCGPEWTAVAIQATPLRSLSLPQLDAIHVMALDDDALRHFFPRLMELMLHTLGPVFDFRLSDLKERLPRWQPDEYAAVQTLSEAVWEQLLHEYPCEVGYFSDCPSALDFLTWCGLDVVAHLDLLTVTDTQTAAQHLADLVDAVLTQRDPFESTSKTTVLDWIRDPAIGARLQSAFFSADSEEAAQQLSAAHELWTVCT
jgi:hypothetical protein